MSQAGIINVVDNNPTIPIYFEADTGTAVALFNVIKVLGDGTNITTSATGNTITITATATGEVTFTGNTGGPITGDSFDIITENSTVLFNTTGSTISLDFIPSAANLSLGSSMTAATTGSGNFNFGYGFDALTTGESNINIGQSLGGLTTGSRNVAISHNGLDITIGDDNVAIGTNAGFNYQSTESDNIVLSNTGSPGENGSIRIGNSSSHLRFFAAGIAGVTVAASSPVAVNSSGQLSSLGLGSSGQLLTSNGAGVSPSWQTPSPASISVNGDAGTMSGPTLTIFANRSAKQAGATVLFENVGALSTFRVTDGTLKNTFLGALSGSLSASGANNSTFGFGGMTNISSGDSNCGLGSTCFENLTTGNRNSGFGVVSLQNITTGSDNIAMGHGAGQAFTGSDSNNIVIGNPGVSGESNTLRIGVTGSGTKEVNKTYIAAIDGVTVAGSAPVGVDSNDQLSSLGFGSVGQVLVSGGPGVSPSWESTGETTSSAVDSGSAISLTTATNADLTSITLSAGKWVITGVVLFGGNPTVTGPQQISVSTTSATHGTLGDNSTQSVWLTANFTVGNVPLSIPTNIVTVGVSTTVYLVCSGAFSGGTMNAYGRISAVKIA